MILHLLEEEKFINRVIEIFEHIFPNDNFFLIGITAPEEKNKYLKEKYTHKVCYSITGTSDYIQKIKTFSNKSKIVFFHNFYKEYKFKLLPYIASHKKIIWYFWGAELYGLCSHKKMNNVLPDTKRIYYKSLSLRTYIIKLFFSKLKKIYYWSKFKSILKHRINYILTNITEDINMLEKYGDHYAKKGWFTYFSIPDTFSFHNNSERKNILIGNSSSATNNHLEAFKILKKKNLKRRKIIIPLSYGDNLYREIVVKYAEKIFGKKAFPIIDYMPLEHYSSIIENCGIVIMNHKRQQAFNTIMLALCNGCKVFLREENTLYQYLKREGFKVFSTEELFHDKNALQPLRSAHQQLNLNRAKQLFSNTNVLERIKWQMYEILNDTTEKSG